MFFVSNVYEIDCLYDKNSHGCLNIFLFKELNAFLSCNKISQFFGLMIKKSFLDYTIVKKFIDNKNKPLN